MKCTRNLLLNEKCNSFVNNLYKKVILIIIHSLCVLNYNINVLNHLRDSFSIQKTVNYIKKFIFLGVKVQDVQAMVENHLKDMILKTFDPKKADTIFTEVGETPAWLTQLIDHPTWRSLIYRLAEEYPDCLMLNFTIKVKINYLLVEFFFGF